ncbi:MAG: esterase/lipase family protein [Planctomycetota bacterium]|jgi:pimeloyl-ACP methyl ester carboxylesterase
MLRAAPILLLALLACEAIKVEHVAPEASYRGAIRTILDSDDVSGFTRAILTALGLTDSYRHEPVEAIRVLEAEMRASRDRKLAVAIAELGIVQARRVTTPDRRAIGTTLRYSYAYLFDPKLEPAPDAFDARFRLACDLYNHALAELTRTSPSLEFREGAMLDLQSYGGDCALRVGHDELAWGNSRMAKLRVAYDYAVEGLLPPARRQGIGLPCLMDRSWVAGAQDNPQDGPDENAALRYLPEQVAFATTILVRFPDDSSVLDAKPADGSLDAYDPMDTVAVDLGGRRVPLEVDYTTPVADSVTRNPSLGGISALLHPDEFEEQVGLYMFQPYRKDRITVLFVHGLASGPETWLPLYNALLADKKIRTRYQFAFWFYPSGQPALGSALQLRKALVEAHDAFGHRDALDANRNMVVCAHSLGGILSNTLVIDSGDILWNEVWTVPPEELPVSEERRERLKNALVFERQKYIKRVIYFSTPHRGAPMAKNKFLQWASGLIHLPDAMIGPDAQLRKYMHKDVRFERYTVDQSLMAHNAVMEAMVDRIKVPSEVTYHSIIGDKDEAGKRGGTDGFVPYWSSHLDGAKSELIIKSGHSTEHMPAGMREAKRILLEHLAAVDAAASKPAR